MTYIDMRHQFFLTGKQRIVMGDFGEVPVSHFGKSTWLM